MSLFSLAEFYMPLVLQTDDQSQNGTVGAIPYWEVNIEADQKVREILELFDGNAQIPGVLIFEQHRLIGLIAREHVYEKLGRPFGVELFLKNSSKQFYESLGITTLILDANTSVDEAVKQALLRDEHALYDPLVVAHENGYRMITMYRLLMAQQKAMQGLYAEVHNLSTKDPLTLVNNRRGFFELVNPQLEKIRYFDLEHAVLVIDIDNFKNVNDRYGHQVGDEVIKSVAQKILEKLGEKDVLGRFGGEEFVIFLVDTSKESALDVAENLRQTIAGFFHTINWFQIRVTVSVGVSHSQGAERTFDRLLTEADQAVYAAKNKGRNKVMVWNEALSQSSTPHALFRTETKGESQPENLPAEALQGLLRLLYLRDNETEAHTMRVTEQTLKLAEQAGIPAEDHEGIRIGALLHDIGKIAIPDKILLKQGKLTKEEFAIMQRHPQYAYDLISPISFFQHALDIPYCHHEHWNGAGYPRGLRGEEIPLAARIFTIVDVWDALSSDRPYRAAWEAEAIKEYIAEKSGVLFDPTLTPIFLKVLKQ